jgi:hypothetical protein
MTAERTKLIQDIREILKQELPNETNWKRDRTTGRLLCVIDHYASEISFADKQTEASE